MQLVPLPAAIAALLLAGCQSVAPASLPTTDALAFEVKSWGVPVHRWTVAADGAANAVKRTSDGGSARPPYTLEHRRFALTSAERAQLAALTAALPDPAPSDDRCEERITDAAYGSLTVSRGAEDRALPFYEGCFDAYYTSYIAQLKAIDTLVMDAAARTPVECLEQVPAETG